MINEYIYKSKKNLLYILFISGIISLYMGLTCGDPALRRGANVINFIFLYCLGYYIRIYAQKLHMIKTWIIGVLYIGLNAVLLLVVSLYYVKWMDFLMTQLFFTYCSVGCIINAVLFFELFRRLHFSNKLINKISKSTFSMYLFHHQHFILYTIIGTIVTWICSSNYSSIIELLLFVLLTIGVMLFTLIIDKPINTLLYTIESKILKINLIRKISNYIE